MRHLARRLALFLAILALVVPGFAPAAGAAAAKAESKAAAKAKPKAASKTASKSAAKTGSRQAAAKKAKAPAKSAKARSKAKGQTASTKVASRQLPAAAVSTGSSLKGKAAAASDPLGGKLSAASAVVMDGETGEILYARSPDLPRQPASTIKILTGYLALSSLRDEDRVRVSRWAASQPRSKVDLTAGAVYRAEDMVNAVLLESANDASVAVAERVAGSETAFAGRMTALARELGAGNTVCRTATGLTASGQQTTARDLAVMFRRLMADRDFAEVMGQRMATTREGKALRSHNRALWQIAGAEGGKTGYTQAARKTYVGKFERHGREVIVAMLGSDRMWPDIADLVEHGFAVLDGSRLVASSDTGSGRAAKARTSL
ncbi:MAG: D-alanyl-D-alanine carboxypeptidase [Thermodesulfobacteriota bacterium]